MPLDQDVKRGQRHLDRFGPGLILPAGRTIRRAHEGLGGGGDRRIVDIELERDRANLAPDRGWLDDDVAVEPIEQFERSHERRLRLDRDDARAEPAEGADAVPHVSTDVEYEVACAHELTIEAIHGGALGAIAVVHT